VKGDDARVYTYDFEPVDLGLLVLDELDKGDLHVGHETILARRLHGGL
jgi:hypothetical protein